MPSIQQGEPVPDFRFIGKTVLFLWLISFAADAQWVTIKTFRVSSAFGDISCPDKNTCFVIGNISVYKTTNGGTTWDSLGANGLGGPNIWFTDAKTGFACGSNGGIWATKNAGASWAMVRGINATDGCQPYVFNDIFFPTPAVGYAAGQVGAMLRTRDSGATWTCSVHSGPDLNGVFFSDTSNGWAVGSSGRIMHTADGGVSWSSQISGTSEDFNCVFFTSATAGFAAGGGTSCVLVSTADGGASWQTISPIGLGPATALWFTSDKVGYIAASNAVYRTKDAGTTWTFMTGGLTNPTGMCFPDAATGYEISSTGAVAKYNGTGVLWPLKTPFAAKGLYVFNDTKSIIIRRNNPHQQSLNALLYDLRGRIVARAAAETGNQARIPIASLGSGAFLLRLEDHNGISSIMPLIFP
jgi:photosystem II stability/assembly factor-like uncharacterized protein